MKKNETPMMQQYLAIKKNYNDALLLFRLGDFYEMFYDDAVEASKILDIVLTQRSQIPMCGIPHHALDNYINRLLVAGKKVALCEQTDKPLKGIATREVVQVVTPGTLVDAKLLEAKENNYLLSLCKKESILSLAFVDLSTAELILIEYEKDYIDFFKKDFYKYAPKEVLLSETFLEEEPLFQNYLKEHKKILINSLPKWHFEKETGERVIQDHFKTLSLKGFNLEHKASIGAIGALFHYLNYASKSLLPHIQHIRIIKNQDYIYLDESSQKNLELVKNLQDSSKNYSLLAVIDKTLSSLGSRFLKNALLNPLRDIHKINMRLYHIEVLLQNTPILNLLQENLKGLSDLERLSAKLALDRSNAKELLSISKSLQLGLVIWEQLETLAILKEKSFPSLKEGERKGMQDLIDFLHHSLQENPAVDLKEGNFIRDGFDSEVDRLRNLKDNGVTLLEDYVKKEANLANINNLKLKYNKIIGYYFDVTKTQEPLIPKHFLLRQSLITGNRYTTERLMLLQEEILNAEETLYKKELELFLVIRKKVQEYIPMFLKVAKKLAYLDFIQSLTTLAMEYNYTQPLLGDFSALYIEEGRHPIVEYYREQGTFISNSLTLGEQNFALITGPNMAGKSTYLRQNALICILAHIGSYVPAKKAEIPLLDKIFCRVGASDNLARGESTFLVEMLETAHILRQATSKSFIIMDEVGRGTATHDGLALAWAISEYILNNLNSYTLFATHYHELSLLNHQKIINLSLAIEEQSDAIIFLRKVIKGAAKKSYGIYVAQLAGLPQSLIHRAEEVLLSLAKEEKDLVKDLEFFDALNTEELNLKNKNIENIQEKILIKKNNIPYDKIKSLNINALSPMDALKFLYDLQKEIE